MTKEQKELMGKIYDTFRDKVCVQVGTEEDKNGSGGCGNPNALTLREIYYVLKGKLYIRFVPHKVIFPMTTSAVDYLK